MRALVTGITGFVGSHLAEHLVFNGDEVIGIAKIEREIDNLGSVRSDVRLHQTDIREARRVREIVSETKPEVIYHLAGEASAGRSLRTPVETVEVNVLGTLNVLEAARACSPMPRVLLITSGEVYGDVRPEELPICEDAEFRPVHPYGSSKVAVHYIGFQYARAFNVPVVEARAFNHIGPRQGLDFVVPDFASQLAQIKLGKRANEVSVGDLSVKRDFTDVRDVVRCYRELVMKGSSGEAYHVCSGRATSIQSLLDTLIKISGLDIRQKTDPAKIRPVRMPEMVGSNRKVRERVGWEPLIPLQKSLEDTYRYWLRREEGD